MIRSILLASSTLALLTVCFAVYHLSAGSVNVKEVEVSTEEHEAFLRQEATSQPTNGFNIRGMNISTGGKILHTHWTPSGKAKVRWRAEKWEPVSETEIHLISPYVEYRMPRGQMVYIEAEEAHIQLQRTDRSRYDPESGWLKGNVFILIDRTSDKWREEHPEQADPVQHPDSVVRIWLDDLNFDLDLARLFSQGNVRVQSAEATIEGEGLELRWNDVDNRIEQLDIRQGKRMVLRRGGGFVQFAMPGTQTEVVVESADLTPSTVAMAGKAIAPNPTSQPAGTTTTQNAVPSPSSPTTVARVSTTAPTSLSGANRAVVLAPKSPTSEPAETGKKMEPTIVLGKDRSHKKKKQLDTYVAQFRGNIRIEQMQGAHVVGGLVAEYLQLVRDFGSDQKDALSADPKDSPEGGKKAKSPSTAATADARKQATDSKKPADDTQLVLVWDGPFQLRPRKTPDDPYAGRRFQVLAKGSPVRIRDRQGTATCAELEYHDETERLWLRGDDAHPVLVQADENRNLRADRELFFDRKTGQAHLQGAGYIKETGGEDSPEVAEAAPSPSPVVSFGNLEGQDRDVRIRWSQDVNLVFQQETTTGKDPETGILIRKRRTYIESAILAGDVSILEGDQKIAGQHVNITFGRPRKTTGFADNIKTFEIQDDVSLTNGMDSITCSRLEVDMAINQAGRNVPKLARAYGNVVAIQESMRTTAKDRMFVRFGSFKKPVRSITLAQARAVAKARGRNPTDAQLKTYLRKRQNQTELGIRDLQGFGGVTVTDPNERLDIRCQDIEASFRNGREIETASFTGEPDHWAYVAASDYVVEGQHVSIDVNEQATIIPGPGRLRFWAAQDLDGRQTNQPLPVAIDWSTEMTLRGKANYGVFDGDVYARSETVSLRCGTMRIDFQDAPEQAVAKPKTPLSTVRSLFGRNRPAPRASRIRLAKRPRFLTAEQNAVVISSSYAKPKQSPLVALITDLNTAVRNVSEKFEPIRKQQSVGQGNVSWAAAFDALRRSVPRGAPTLADPTTQGPPLSRMRIAGPTLLVDFRKKTSNIQGAGSLLIEDYRASSSEFLKKQRGKKAGRSSDLVIGSISGSEPSQTLIRWLNSMSFFSDRNLAIFDQGVTMLHKAGSEMVLRDDLIKAFNIDENAVRRMKGRQAKLRCDNLLVEFLRTSDRQAGGALEDQMAATELNQFRASGGCYLQEGTRSILGEQIIYNRNANIVTIEGSASTQARIFNQDESKGVFQSYHGSKVRWYRDVNRIEVYDATIISKGN